MSWRFRRVASCDGEAAGLLWDGSGVLMCAVDESRILRYSPHAGTLSEVRRYTNRVSALARGPQGRIYATQSGSRRLIQFNQDGSATPMESRLDGHLHNHPRDLSVDVHGRIWFTDPHSSLPSPGPQVHAQLEHASVLRLSRSPDRHWRLDRATYDTAYPTAVQVSADSSTLYVSDNHPLPSGRRDIRAYTIRDDGSLSEPTVLHTFGFDFRGCHRGAWGMEIDAQGNLLVVAGGAGAGPGPLLYVLEPTGRVLATHRLDEDPMDVCLGGTEVYVSTRQGSLLRGLVSNR